MTTITESPVNDVLERLIEDNAPDELLNAVLAAAQGEAAFTAWTGRTARSRLTTGGLTQMNASLLLSKVTDPRPRTSR